MTGDLLQIQRLVLDYHIAAGKREPKAVSSRLDRVLSRQLEHRFAPVFDDLRSHGDGLWFIRRLELDFDCDLEFDDSEIGQRWVRRLGQTLARLLADEQSDEICYFNDQSHYLASFVTDLAQGNAWRQWYYHLFDGLRALPTSVALRTALLRRPEEGLAAMQHLTRPNRARVLNSLGPSEARRCLVGFANPTGKTQNTASDRQTNPLYSEVIHDFLLLARQSRRTPVPVNETAWIAALDLYLDLLEQHPGSGGPALAELCLPLLYAVRLSGKQQSVLVQALLKGSASPLPPHLSADQWDLLRPLISLPAQLRESLSRQLQESVTTTQPMEQGYTPFGGMFLLLPLLAHLPLESVTAAWPKPVGQETASLLRLILLGQSLGSLHELLDDSLLRNLLAINEPLSQAEISHWLEELPGEAISDTQQHLFKQRLQELDYPDVHLIGVEHDNRLWALAVEQRKGGWLLLQELHADQMTTFRQTLQERLPEACSLLSVSDSKLAKQELQALQPPKKLACPQQLTDLLTCLSQNLLRDFASRLPGFSNSSVEYLRRNFLNLDANLQREDEHDRVILGRPPLHLVLNMTGQMNREYRLPWRDRPLLLET